MASIGIYGRLGRMGQAIAAVIPELGATLAGGADAGENPEGIARRADVLVDFSAAVAVDAHIAAARDLIAKGGAVGRKLDFLCQEFNREANTLCSKSADIGLTGIGIDLKAAIEQLREQIQNIE